MRSSQEKRTEKLLKNANRGFTIIEVMVGILILSVAFIGMMMGITYARAQLESMAIEERAIQELTNYTEYWKARIFDGRLSQREMAKDSQGEEILLYEFDNEAKPIVGRLYKEAIKKEINPLYRWVSYYTVECRIEWEDFSTYPSVTRERSMKVTVGKLDYGV